MSTRRRVATAVVLSLLVAVLGCGCWDRHETNDTAFVLAAGVSRAPNGDFRLVAEIAQPRKMGKSSEQGNGGGGGSGLIREATGKSLYMAFARLGALVGRTIDDSHCNILIVQETVAKDGGLAEIFDWMTRYYQIRHRKVVLVSQVDPAAILTASPELDPMQGLNVFKMLETAKEDCLPGFESTLMDIMSRQSTLGLHVILGRVSVETSETGSRDTVFDGIDILDGVRLIGALPRDESRYANLLLNEARGSSLILELPATGLGGIATPTPGYHGGEDAPAEEAPIPPGPTVVHATSGGTQIRARLDGGIPVVDVSVKLKGEVIETATPLDLGSTKVLKSLESTLSQYVADRVRATIALTQSFQKGCDIFFIGEAIHDRYPAVWHEISDNWDQYYKTLKVNVTVDGSITNTGRTLEPSVPHR